VEVTCEKFANLPLLLELISDKVFVAYIFVTITRVLEWNAVRGAFGLCRNTVPLCCCSLWTPSSLVYFLSFCWAKCQSCNSIAVTLHSHIG